MGLTFLDVAIINPGQSDKEQVFEFLVDSGAVYSVVPSSDLQDLGIEPTSTETFILANGERIEKRVGNAFFRFDEKVRAAPVIFGEPDVYLLGATTLEALGLILDPINRKLKPLPMSLMAMR